jgi:hypothetical protein
MPIVFDEIVGEIAPQPRSAANDEAPSEPSAPEADAQRLLALVERAQWRRQRLAAD